MTDHTAFQAVFALKDVVDKLSPKDQPFATSLIEAFTKHGSLSTKQLYWVGVLTHRATPQVKTPVQLQALPTPQQLGSFDGVIALFTQAKTHLKFPKIYLKVDGKPVILSLAGPASKAHGSITVTGEGLYPHRKYYGKVSPEGVWSPSLTLTPEMQTALVTLLTKLGKHPARVAKEYGKLTGHCCFCHKVLGKGEDQRSVTVGYGPVCADHYGLKAQWLAAASQVTAPVVNQTLLTQETAEGMADALQHAAEGAITTTVASVPAFQVFASYEPTTQADGEGPLTAMEAVDYLQAMQDEADATSHSADPEEESEAMKAYYKGLAKGTVLQQILEAEATLKAVEDKMFQQVMESAVPCYVCEQLVIPSEARIREGMTVCAACDTELGV